MDGASKANSWWQRAIDFGIDVTLLEANLALTPAQRLRELVAMNRLQDQIQARTLTPAQRAAIDARELELKFGSPVDDGGGDPQKQVPLRHATARASTDG